MRFVKVIATLGPSSIGVLDELIKYVDGLRINFSHGDPTSWEEWVRSVRGLSSEIALLGDLKGPSVRTGKMAVPISLKPGEKVEFRLAEYSQGDFVPVPSSAFFRILDVNDIVIMRDGRLRLQVERVGRDHAVLTALTCETISSEQAIVIKGKEYPLPVLTEYDRMTLRFAVEHGFDYIGVSYVRGAEDVEEVKSELKRLRGEGVRVVAKIETLSAVRNINEILDVADYVMVARGDLGMHYNLEEIPRIQREIVRKAHRKGVPVMVATQLLESMINNPTPTRAEVVDVANAVLEGVDSLLLTGETAIGRYPIEAVKWLNRIAREYEGNAESIREALTGLAERLALSVVQLAENLNAKIVVYSRSGWFAAALARFKPKVPIYTGVCEYAIARRLRLLWGVEPIIVPCLDDYEAGEEETLKALMERNLVVRGDLVVLTHGIAGLYGKYGIKIVRV